MLVDVPKCKVDTMFSRLWQKYIAPILRRPPSFQVAALCYRHTDSGLEILLITSLDTGRWILPKGWPVTGLDSEGTALWEAWEEAGVKPVEETREFIGHYRYNKAVGGGVPIPTDVKVFSVEVAELADEYPEADQRQRRWMKREEASRFVDEPDLKVLLAGFEAPEHKGVDA
jgi:8-oxo-dGTP pyrophosphatase MutT (NUDIX family)